MATALTVKSVTKLQNLFMVTGSIALSGSYATHGDALNFVNASIPVMTAKPPVFVQIGESPAAGTTASGYVFRFATGSDLTNGALQVFEVPDETTPAAAEPLAELAAGAYPAGLTGAAVNFLALFTSL